MMQQKRTVIFLMGPTAAGKTDLALQLFHRMPCELISVDSAMVYRGMDIGTAKPSKVVLETVPHHLVDICDPAESYSVAQFCDDALNATEQIFQRNRTPVLVGGTGLYFRSLEKGLSPLPKANPKIRKEITDAAANQGWDSLYLRLQEVDPVTAMRIHINDPQRIQRALEVYMVTGRAMSNILQQEGRTGALPFSIFKIVFSPSDRSIIYKQVERRFFRMLDAGLVDEVKKLFERGDLNSSMPSIRVVGYRQIWRYLEQKIGFDSIKEHTINAARKLVRRQLTWCRSEQHAYWYDSTDPLALDKIMAQYLKAS